MNDPLRHNPGSLARNRCALAALLLSLLALAAYLAAAGRLAVDFPYWDDYYAVLDSLGKVRASETVTGKVAAVFSQHNEHRVAWLRAVALTCWAVQGRVDFRTLIWLGNTGLIALAVILMAGSRRSVRWPSLLALIPLALLSPIQGKQMIWAMAALSNYWVLAFAAVALLLLSAGTGPAFGWACVSAVLATFTSGQGLLCFPAGLALLVVERRWPRALGWLGIMGLSALAYFHNYTRPSYHPAPEISWSGGPVLSGGGGRRPQQPSVPVSWCRYWRTHAGKPPWGDHSGRKTGLALIWARGVVVGAAILPAKPLCERVPTVSAAALCDRFRVT